MKTPIVSLKNGMGIELIRRDENYIRFLKDFDPGEADEETVYYGAHVQQTGQSYGTNSKEHEQKQAKSGAGPSDNFMIIVCPQCSVKNKVRTEKLSQGPKCGKCGAFLVPQT